MSIFYFFLFFSSAFSTISFLLHLQNHLCFLPSHSFIYWHSLLYFFEATLLYPVVQDVCNIWSQSVGSNTFTLWLWVKYDFNYHENVLYYQWEDKNRLRKLWDALIDDNGQVFMWAVVLEKIHSLTKALRKGGGSTCKTNPTGPWCVYDLYLSFLSIEWTLFPKGSYIQTNIEWTGWSWHVGKLQPTILGKYNMQRLLSTCWNCVQIPSIRPHMTIMKFIN